MCHEGETMSDVIVDVMLHIDETLSNEELESIRNNFLCMEGVAAASYHEDKRHLMIIEYDPEVVQSSQFLEEIKVQGFHAKLVGL